MRIALVLGLVGCASTPGLGQGGRVSSGPKTVVDTTRPPVPSKVDLPADSTFTVQGRGYPRSQLLYYRNIVRVGFDDTTSGATIRRLFTRYQATVIGGIPGPADPEYVLQVPDPGTTLEALESLVARLATEPGVRSAASVYYRTPGSVYSQPKSP
jgi:hypothetical protein